MNEVLSPLLYAAYQSPKSSRSFPSRSLSLPATVSLACFAAGVSGWMSGWEEQRSERDCKRPAHNIGTVAIATNQIQACFSAPPFLFPPSSPPPFPPSPSTPSTSPTLMWHMCTQSHEKQGGLYIEMLMVGSKKNHTITTASNIPHSTYQKQGIRALQMKAKAHFRLLQFSVSSFRIYLIAYTCMLAQ